MSTHQQLMQVYDKGVEIFQSRQDHTQGDTYVRGMGAETGKELTRVISQIQERQTSGIVENQQKIQRTMLVTSTAMVLIIIVFSILLILALIKPIQRIVRFNHYLGSNLNYRGLQYEDSLHKQDEIGNMIESHNHLLKTIEDYHANLEDKVEERTAQLEKANDEIKTLNQLLRKENVRLSSEVEVTRKIQQMILPKDDEIKNIPRLDIATFMQPASEVGGDYYDILQYGDRIKIGIGDVTGHGLESGVLMLMVQTAVRTLLANDERSSVRFLNTINRIIYDNVQRMDSQKNLTLALLEYHDGSITLSGQHEEVLLVRKNGLIERIDTIELGLPIGLDDDIEQFISEMDLHINPGDGLVLYTDGITEAENLDGEQYQLDRLCDVIQSNWQYPSEDILRGIIKDLETYIGEQKVYDDITLIVIKQKEIEEMNLVS